MTNTALAYREYRECKKRVEAALYALHVSVERAFPVGSLLTYPRGDQRCTATVVGHCGRWPDRVSLQVSGRAGTTYWITDFGIKPVPRRRAVSDLRKPAGEGG